MRENPVMGALVFDEEVEEDLLDFEAVGAEVELLLRPEELRPEYELDPG
jgi:hypothetical protein